MKRIVSLLFGVLLLASANLRGDPLGTAFTYQGQLTDGTAPAAGTYDLAFRLFEAESGGASPLPPLFRLGVVPDEGTFSVELDFGQTLFNGSATWLEVQVKAAGTATWTTLTPRQRLRPVPNAVYAAKTTTAATATNALAVPWSGITGVPAGFADGTDDGAAYTAGAGLTLVGNQFAVSFGGLGSAATAAHSDHHHDAAYQAVNAAASGDLSGTYPNPTVAALRGRAVAGTAPAAGQVLKWNGTASNWEPAPDQTGTGDVTAVTAGAGLTGGGASGDVSLAAAFDGTGSASTVARSDHNHTGTYQAVNAAASGDLSGTYPNPTVAALRGRAVAGTAPAAGQVLKWNGTALNWEPAPDQAGTGDVTAVTAGAGLTGGGASGDVSIAASFAGTGSAATVAHSDHDHDASYQAVNAAAGGDLAGAYPSPTVGGLRGRAVAAAAPAAGQVLKWNDAASQWEPAPDQAGSGDINGVAAGAGLLGGGASGDVGLAVEFAGSGAATSSARSDHDHSGTYAPVAHPHDAAAINAGTLDDARLSANIPRLDADQVFSGMNSLKNPGNAFAGDGSGLTGLDAGQLAVGTVPVDRLGDNSIAAAKLASDSAGLAKVSGGQLAVNGDRVYLPQVTSNPILTNAFTGLGFQYYWGSGEGAILSSYESGQGYITFYTKAHGTPVTRRMVINQDGRVGIGTDSPGSYLLYVNGNAFANGTWGSSDARWKKEVKPLTNALELVKQLRGVSYEWRREEYPERQFDAGTQVGFLAQEAEQVLPALVRTDASGYKAMAYDKLTAVLAEGMKEQQDQIESLRSHNAALERQVSELSALVGRLIERTNAQTP